MHLPRIALVVIAGLGLQGEALAAEKGRHLVVVGRTQQKTSPDYAAAIAELNEHLGVLRRLYISKGGSAADLGLFPAEDGAYIRPSAGTFVSVWNHRPALAILTGSMNKVGEAFISRHTVYIGDRGIGAYNFNDVRGMMKRNSESGMEAQLAILAYALLIDAWASKRERAIGPLVATVQTLLHKPALREGIFPCARDITRGVERIVQLGKGETQPSRLAPLSSECLP